MIKVTMYDQDNYGCVIEFSKLKDARTFAKEFGLEITKIERPRRSISPKSETLPAKVS